jgi:hypothetical protein
MKVQLLVWYQFSALTAEMQRRRRWSQRAIGKNSRASAHGAAHSLKRFPVGCSWRTKPVVHQPAAGTHITRTKTTCRRCARHVIYRLANLSPERHIGQVRSTRLDSHVLWTSFTPAVTLYVTCWEPRSHVYRQPYYLRLLAKKNAACFTVPESILVTLLRQDAKCVDANMKTWMVTESLLQ